MKSLPEPLPDEGSNVNMDLVESHESDMIFEHGRIEGIADGRRLERERWIAELSKVMPDDFKDWHENADEEKPAVARMVIESMRQREELAWGQLELVEKGRRCSTSTQ